MNIGKFFVDLSDRFLISRVNFFSDKFQSIGEQLRQASQKLYSFYKPLLYNNTPTLDIPTAEHVLVSILGKLKNAGGYLKEALNYLSGHVSQFWKGELPYFVFPYNPKTISYKFATIESLNEFGGNVVVRVGWGSKVIPISVTGWVRLQPPVEIQKWLGYPDYRLSWGWLFLLVLEHWLRRNSNNTLAILINSRVWVGWYNNFSYTFDANNPFIANYTLNFNVHPLSGVTYFEPHKLIEMFRNLRKAGVLSTLSIEDPLSWSVWSPDLNSKE